MKPSSRLTETEKHQIATMRAKGETFERIAETLGRSKVGIEDWYRHRRTGLEETPPRSVKKSRPCMCCGRRFLSAGSHNRLCARCKTTEITPFDFLGDKA